MAEDEAIQTAETTEAPNGSESAPETGSESQGQARDELGRFLAKHGLPDDETQPAEDGGEAVPASETQTPTAETATPPKEDEPAAPKGLSERGQQAARHLGYSDAEISEMTATEEAHLLRAESRLGRKMSELGAKQQKLQAGQLPQRLGEQKTDGDDEIPMLEDADWDDSERFNGKLNGLVTVVRGLMKAERGRQQAAEAAESDAFWAGLTDDKDQPLFGDKYGLEPSSALDPKGGQAKARQDILTAALAIEAGYRLTGRELTRKEALQMALDHHERDTLDNIARSAARAKVDARARHAVPKAPQRRPSSPGDPDAALDAAWNDWERKTGKKLPA